MIRNVVFDLGQVLFRFSPKHYLDEKFSKERSEILFKEVFREKEWQKLNKGIITVQEAIDSIVGRGAVSYDEAKEIFDERKLLVTPIQENLQVVEDIKKNGYKVFILANFSRDLFKKYYEEIPSLKDFDGKVISYEVNLLKSEKEIYNYFLKKYQINPMETLFIDDTPHNIENAEYFGIKGLCLKKPEDLKKELKNLELL